RVHFANIDDAIRRAVVRGVKIRFLAAALHYPDIGTRFLKSLESLNGFHANGTMEVVSLGLGDQQVGVSPDLQSIQISECQNFQFIHIMNQGMS
ncbi:Protein CBG05699, partial [Caenorhabditis briggsae]